MNMDNENTKLMIFVLSDSLGETAEQVAKAAVAQYNNIIVEINKVAYVTHTETIKDVINEAANYNSVVMFTLVLPELREFLIQEAVKHGIICVDILGPVIKSIGDVTKALPTYTPGIIRRLDEEYFKKVEAIEFAVKYDDGKDAKGISKADVILLGVSRTSKTPLSMYLAIKNIKVTNIPLVPEVKPPQELYEINPKKIIGLTNSPLKLNAIRQERLKALGLSNEANYANMERIMEELDYAEKIMKGLGCPIIDVTTKAIEETAGIILKLIKEGK